MLIRIDPKSNTPVFEQIVQEIKSAIARSASVPDEMTPSVRQMATDILVNPNTVVSQGLSPSRARRRVIYASWAWRLCRGDGPPDACRMARRESVRQELRRVIGEAQRTGMTRTEVQSEIDRIPDIMPDGPAYRGRISVK